MSGIQFLDPNSICLSKFIYSEEIKQWESSGELTEVLKCLQVVAKNISALVRVSGVDYFFKMKNKENDFEQLVSLANDIFISVLFASESVGVMISKILKSVVEKHKESKGKYIVCYDPLNGMTNVDSSTAVSSIFSIMVKESQDIPNLEDAMNPHTQIVAAGYILYGGSTTFVFATRGGEVNGFVLDPQLGEFFLIDTNMRIPKRGSIYSIHEGDAKFWDEGLTKYVSEKKAPPYNTARYTGSLVADIHMIMIDGGIFMNPDKPPRGLELLCECKPLAFLVYQAEGAATNGLHPILDLKVHDIHEKTPLFIGSRDDVEDLMKVFEKYRTQLLMKQM